jgi:hypothetical protein
VRAIVRYRDSRVIAVNLDARIYTAVGLRERLAEVSRQRAAVERPGQLSWIQAPTSASPPPSLPAAVVTRNSTVVKVSGLRAQLYVVAQGPLVQRFWVALDIPRPPAAIRNTVVASAAVAARGSATRALRLATDRVVLRREVRTPRGWVRTLETIRVQRRDVAPATFEVPTRFVRVSARVPHKFRRPAMVPASVGGHLGPISANPRLYALYWGEKFKVAGTANPFVEQMNGFLKSVMLDEPFQPFWNPLGQYGIGPGELIGAGIIARDPPHDAGVLHYAALVATVYEAMLFHRAPIAWPPFVGFDPVIGIFVPQSALPSTGWGGYHFVVPAPTAFMGWPWSIVGGYAIPYFVTLVPDAGFGSDGAAAATETTSHELVEAVSDPIPPTGILDLFGTPAWWIHGELADICSTDPHLPWQSHVPIGGFPLSTWWSQAAQACVPDTLPTVVITTPLNGATLRRDFPIPYAARATDPNAGDISRHVTWTLDGKSLASGGGGTIGPRELSAGHHTLTATVSNGYATATPVGTIFTVFDPPVYGARVLAVAPPPAIQVPGQRSTATITLVNDGTTPLLRSGSTPTRCAATDPQGRESAWLDPTAPNAVGRKAVAIDQDITAPGETFTCTLSLVAPPVVGAHEERFGVQIENVALLPTPPVSLAVAILTCRELAQEIERLRAEIRALQQALKIAAPGEKPGLVREIDELSKSLGELNAVQRNC